MYCIKCGSENLNVGKFCQNCGFEINSNALDQEKIKKKRNYYFDVLKKYAVFEGRATRKEYWMFFLFNILIAIALGLIEGITGINSESDESLLGSIYQLIIFLPSLAVSIRRMHDVDKNGWYLFIPVYSFILLVRDGTNGENKYGPNPKTNG